MPDGMDQDRNVRGQSKGPIQEAARKHEAADRSEQAAYRIRCAKLTYLYIDKTMRTPWPLQAIAVPIVLTERTRIWLYRLITKISSEVENAIAVICVRTR